MTNRIFLAAAVLILVPTAVIGAAEPQQRGSDRNTKRICEVDSTIGTRLSSTRRCRTKAERDAHKQEAREVVDRIQTFKVTCPGTGLCG